LSIFTTTIGPPSPPGSPEIGLKPVLTVSLGSGVASVAVSVDPAQADNANVSEVKKANAFNLLVILQTISANLELRKTQLTHLWVMFQKTDG
jgi:hypothetical protein